MNSIQYLRPAPFDILRLLESDDRHLVPLFIPVFAGINREAYPSLQALIYRKHKYHFIDELPEFWNHLEGLIRADVLPGISLAESGERFLIQEEFTIKDASPKSKLLSGIYLADGTHFIRKLSKRGFISFMKRRQPFTHHKAVNMPDDLCRIGINVSSSWISSLSYASLSSIKNTFQNRELVGFEAFRAAWNHHYKKYPLLTTVQDPLVKVFLCQPFPNPKITDEE